MTITTTNHFTINEGLVRILVMVVIVVIAFVFGKSLLALISRLMRGITDKLFGRMSDATYAIQRYVYLHPKSPFTSLYNWVNLQLVASNLKRQGVTPTGYILFWSLLSVILSVAFQIIFNIGAGWCLTMMVAFFVASMVLTRVFVSSAIETREMAVMNAIDLIVPEISNGVKNAIAQYLDNFDDLVQPDFQEFITNIQDRGYSFDDSMMILTDNLGPVFRNFAQKAIYFESSGEQMAEVFADITETNRLRRQMREENDVTFASLKSSFVLSTVIVVGYFCFLMFTDEFSREFLLESTGGNICLVIILIIIFAVMSYITTLKSRAL